MSALPYITAPGNIDKALRGIQTAATPERVTQDFVKTILQIRGGSGNQITSYLKKIGFVNPDGTPSDIYKSFRNPSTLGRAATEALKFGYSALYMRNEYMHKLGDEELRGLIIEETGLGKDANVVALILSAIKTLKKFASQSSGSLDEDKSVKPIIPLLDNGTKEGSSKGESEGSVKNSSLGLNLSYTINLNLPATSDSAVFTAIFKSLKENLLNS